MQLAMVAADYTPGEADQLRRAMAAWKRKGGLGPHQRATDFAHDERRATAEFAERVFKQIEGFGEYGFPESHAASFALLVYVSCWLKRIIPTPFWPALLNSQPMGFYAPAQLVQDARRHGVEVRAVDVTISQVESTLEPPDKWSRNEGGAAGIESHQRAQRRFDQAHRRSPQRTRIRQCRRSGDACAS